MPRGKQEKGKYIWIISPRLQLYSVWVFVQSDGFFMYLVNPRGFLFHVLDQFSFRQMQVLALIALAPTVYHSFAFVFSECGFYSIHLMSLSSHTGRHSKYVFWKKRYVLRVVLNIIPANYIESSLVAAWERQEVTAFFLLNIQYFLYFYCVLPFLPLI